MKKILWVDDEPTNNNVVGSLIKQNGFDIVYAKNTKDALDLIEDNNFDVIISDMGRVEGPLEGYVLLENIRKFDNVTPFFIYASSNAKKHKDKALRLGAQGSTSKPKELFEFLKITF